TERGIKARNGYASERFRIEPEFAVKVDPSLGLLAVLLEPTSIVAKAWDHTDGIGRRARYFEPRPAAITRAGPVGLLAALMGVQRGLEIHVIDHNKDGPKPELVHAVGGIHHHDMDDLARITPDIVMECTGAAAVVRGVLGSTAPAGIACLLSVTASHTMEIDM